jgi:alpha-L-fucosidase
VYVAKHSCGFTTWPTRVTLPDGSPYRYSVQYSSCPTCNVVADFLAMCDKYGIRPGFYYSIAINTYLNVEGGVVQPNPLPGQAVVTTRQFYDIALAQLEELWGFAPGRLFEVWFDGGLPQDDYFRTRILALLQRLQPTATAFNGFPDINATAARWIGTEAGVAPDPTWSTGSCAMGNPVCNDCQGGDGGSPTDPNWCPAEVDSTMQQFDTWFYVEGLAVHPLRDLQATYLTSLGHNSNWILDIAPPPNSTVVPAHMQQYQALGDWIRGCFNNALGSAAMPAGATSLQLDLGAARTASHLRLREDQSAGQLVHKYQVEAQSSSGSWSVVARGTSIGSGKIDLFVPHVTARHFRLTVDAAPTALELEVFFC